MWHVKRLCFSLNIMLPEYTKKCTSHIHLLIFQCKNHSPGEPPVPREKRYRYNTRMFKTIFIRLLFITNITCLQTTYPKKVDFRHPVHANTWMCQWKKSTHRKERKTGCKTLRFTMDWKYRNIDVYLELTRFLQALNISPSTLLASLVTSSSLRKMWSYKCYLVCLARHNTEGK